MGCRFSKENWCFSLTCCFCMTDRPACYWIGGVGLVWGGFAAIFDFISAHLPRLYCTRCIDYNLNHYLSLTGGGINTVQWVTSCFLIHGARKEIRWMVGVWLAWAAVSIGMQLLWFCITLPYTPSIRGFASFFQLVWGIHYFIVIKTHFTRMSLTFTPPEEPLKPVPPNSPARKHRRHKRRIDQSSQPPIRTLLGAAIKLQGEVLKRQKERETIEILAAGEEDEESEVEVLVVRRTSRGGGGGTEEEREAFELQPIGARPADEEEGNDAREEGDEDDEGRKEGIARATRSGSGRRRGASTNEEEAFETDGMQEERKKRKKNKKRKRREKKRQEEEGEHGKKAVAK
ncbi:uncharacterized protein LOC119590703 [Penaeus monodon]|uniref:uncharacterized protein LOC119590703 n=1 Tax=Penaeus monodon TaxID=6687 RepID=UPI0018A79F27|nr:uncharacterized protein LOC119590703 [Penaeus monodon]